MSTSNPTETETRETENQIISTLLKKISGEGPTQENPLGGAAFVQAHATFLQAVSMRRSNPSLRFAEPAAASAPAVPLVKPAANTTAERPVSEAVHKAPAPSAPAPGAHAAAPASAPAAVAVPVPVVASAVAPVATVAGTPIAFSTAPAAPVASAAPVAPVPPVAAGQS